MRRVTVGWLIMLAAVSNGCSSDDGAGLGDQTGTGESAGTSNAGSNAIQTGTGGATALVHRMPAALRAVVRRAWGAEAPGERITWARAALAREARAVRVWRERAALAALAAAGAFLSTAAHQPRRRARRLRSRLGSGLRSRGPASERSALREHGRMHVHPSP